jgi:hypothetical protein
VRRWFTQAEGRSLFSKRQHLYGPFSFKAAPFAGGFFLGDYEGLTATKGDDQGFLPLLAVTNSRDTRCAAEANPTGAPTGRRDPTDSLQ